MPEVAGSFALLANDIVSMLAKRMGQDVRVVDDLMGRHFDFIFKELQKRYRVSVDFLRDTFEDKLPPWPGSMEELQWMMTGRLPNDQVEREKRLSELRRRTLLDFVDHIEWVMRR